MQKYEVTFDDCNPLTDNVVLSVSANAAFSSEHALPQAPAYEGFTFDGWYYYDPHVWREVRFERSCDGRHVRCGEVD